MNENYIFDWDDEINNESSNYVLLPEGDYRFKIEKFERSQFDGSEKLPACKKAIVTFHIFGENNETSITENFLLCSQFEWKLSSLFLSVSLKKHNEPLRMNWNALIGKEGNCHVYIDNYKKKDGSDGYSNKIKKFYAYDEDVDPIEPKSQIQPIQNSSHKWQAGKF